MVVGGQRHAPAALPTTNTRYPLYRRLVGLKSRSRRVRKICPHSWLSGLRETAKDISEVIRIHS